MSDPHSGHRALYELTKARFLEFIRDPSAIFWSFAFPVIMALVLGIAFRSSGPEEIRVAVTGPGAENFLLLIDKGAPSGWYKPFKPELMTEAKATDFLRNGRVELVVFVPGAPSIGSPMIYRFDPSKPGAQTARLAFDNVIQRVFGKVEPVPSKDERLTEIGGRYIDFLLPGLIGLNILGSCTWGLGYAVVDLRKRKLLKRYAVTPMNRSHFLLSFALSRLVFLAVEVCVIVVAGYLLFDVRVQGRLASLGIAALCGTIAFFGISLLVASRTESTETANGWLNFVQVPMWLLSGSFFSYSRFPEAIQPFIKALPLTALNDSMRAVFNEGAGLITIAPQLAVMVVWGLVTFSLAVRFFKWQ